MSMEDYRYTKWYLAGLNRPLVEWMVNHGVTPFKLAQDTGLGRSTIYAAIFKKRSLRQDNCEILMDYTKMTYEELFR